MQPMEHNPGAVGIGAQVVANGARGLAAGTTASAEVTALVPAGADEVSAQAALAFASEGVEALALNALCAGRAVPRGSGVHGGRGHLHRGRRRERRQLLTDSPSHYNRASEPALPRFAMFWHGMPPELNTARLMAGAGAAPMLQAAAGWEALAISLETQADELAASLAALSSAWSGTASERAVAATMPMVVWLRTAPLQAHEAGIAGDRAGELLRARRWRPPRRYRRSSRTTSPTRVLEATNFLGVNTVPIARQRGRLLRPDVESGRRRDGRLSGRDGCRTSLFEPIAPMKPIVDARRR